MKKYTDLHESNRYRGSAEKGEIEIVCTPDDPLPVVFENKYITIVNDQVVFPSGQRGNYMRLFSAGDLVGQHGVVVLPHFRGRIYLVRIFRHATRSWHLELPRGFAEPDCTIADNARREVKEELGVSIKTLTKLGTVCPDTGLSASRVEVFFAELSNSPKMSQAHLDTEAISAYEDFDIAGIKTLIRSGEIQDGFTLSALMLALCVGAVG